MFSLLFSTQVLSKAHHHHKIFGDNNCWTINSVQNAWQLQGKTIRFNVNQGTLNWNDPSTVLYYQARYSATGTFQVSLLISDSNARLQVSVQDTIVQVDVVAPAGQPTTILVGDFTISQVGYVPIKVKGISKTSSTYGKIRGIKVCGDILQNLVFVKDPNYGWGKQGANIWLDYVSNSRNIQWQYNQITVPAGQDVLSTYYMAIGFNNGYCGIQVNSATQRRILFSVWSPYSTNNPKLVPKQCNVLLNYKADGVTARQFGGQGSGGQTFKNIMWSTDRTYKFLVHTQPTPSNSSVSYTLFFFSQQTGWYKFASMSRPLTNGYGNYFASFLQNFAGAGTPNVNGGSVARYAKYSNQWICESNSNCRQVLSARVNTDDCGKKYYRRDSIGWNQTNYNGYYLRMGGFRSQNIAQGLLLYRAPTLGNFPANLDQIRNL